MSIVLLLLRPLLTASILISLAVQGGIWDGCRAAIKGELARVSTVAGAAAWLLVNENASITAGVTLVAWIVFVMHTLSALLIVTNPNLLAATCYIQ